MTLPALYLVLLEAPNGRRHVLRPYDVRCVCRTLIGPRWKVIRDYQLPGSALSASTCLKCKKSLGKSFLREDRKR